MRVVLAGPAAARASLAPLLDAWRTAGHTVRTAPQGQLHRLAGEHDAVLLVPPRNRAPATTVPGPVLDVDGRHCVIATVPDLGAAALGTFAACAARVHQRVPAVTACADGTMSLAPGGATATPGPCALAGQWHPKFLALCDRIERLLTAGHAPIEVFRWTSDRLVREDLVRGLRSGLAAAIYVGHGRPNGWVGYRGLRLQHFEDSQVAAVDARRGTVTAREPLAVLISLCCRTASRYRTGLSFSEGAVTAGIAAASLGAICPTRHQDNARWALRLSQVLREGAANVTDLLLRALPPSAEAQRAYRILGDPLAPLCAATQARQLATQVEACA